MYQFYVLGMSLQTCFSMFAHIIKSGGQLVISTLTNTIKECIRKRKINLSSGIGDSRIQYACSINLIFFRYQMVLQIREDLLKGR